MKVIKKVRKYLTKGKVEKTEDVMEKESRLSEPKEVIKRVMDSTADSLIINGEGELYEAKDKEKTVTIEMWIEAEQKPSTEEFILNATGKELKAFASENDIDLGDATKVEDIRNAVKGYFNIK